MHATRDRPCRCSSTRKVRSGHSFLRSRRTETKKTRSGFHEHSGPLPNLEKVVSGSLFYGPISHSRRSRAHAPHTCTRYFTRDRSWSSRRRLYSKHCFVFRRRSRTSYTVQIEPREKHNRKCLATLSPQPVLFRFSVKIIIFPPVPPS